MKQNFTPGKFFRLSGLTGLRPLMLAALGLVTGIQLSAQTTFTYTGAMQTYTVPAGVTSIQTEVWGAQGEASGSSTGGLGGYVKANMAVTPGQVLNIYVGGQTGFNGGGADGTGGGYTAGKGGGATDIRVAGTALTDRVIVAGGGGGAGRNSCSNQTGGAGGYPGGIGGLGDGAQGTTGGVNGGGVSGGGGRGTCCSSSRGGGGGGQNGGGGQGGYGSSTGGSAGGCGGDNSDYSGGCGNPAGGGGCFGLGGNGLNPGCNGGGGGGGGGWYGGGSGGGNWGSGGGGGSSYYAGTLTSPSTSNGIRTGDGQAVITVLATPGAALNFDGGNDFVNIGAGMNSILDGMNTITVEAWVNPTNTTFLGCIAGNYQTTGTGMQFLLRRDYDTYAFWVDDGGGFEVVTTGSVVSLGTWQHVAGVWDGSTLKIYLNGVLQNTTTGVTGSTFASSVNEVYFGQNSIGEGFNGSIDEIRIWSTAKNQCEIAGNMSCEIPTTATGLLANYHFNHGISANPNPGITTLTDYAGVYSGTLNNFGLTAGTSNWTAPGGVISGSACAPLILPEVNTTGNSVTIANGDAVPSASDFTDFGAMSVCNGTLTRTFTIENTGGASLTISGVSIVGTAAADFSVTTPPAGSVAASGSTTFTVTFDPSASGSRLAAINIATNDCSDPVYAFAIEGNGSQIAASAVSQTNVSCNAGSDGIATAGSTGGLGTLSYSWAPSGGTAATATGLTAGTYTCTVTDANTCTSTATFTITEPPAITVTPGATTNVSCNAGTDGSASVSAAGGTGTLSYMWMPSGGTAATATGLAAGTYTCTVTDANTCTSTATFTITEPTAVTVTPSTTTNVSCNAGSDGSASVSAAGGTGTLSYSWSPSGGTAATATGLTAGTYTCTVTDANMCSSMTIITITEPAAIDITTSTGGITITSNATGGVTYQWVDCDNSNLPISGETNQSYTASANGNYAVVVTDGVCSATSACVNIMSVGISANGGNAQIVVYPNPFSNNVTITNIANSTEPVYLTITTVLGQVVYSDQLTDKQTVVDLSNQTSGVYLIQIRSNNEVSTRRIIKE